VRTGPLVTSRYRIGANDSLTEKGGEVVGLNDDERGRCSEEEGCKVNRRSKDRRNGNERRVETRWERKEETSDTLLQHCRPCLYPSETTF
jgi:hypothetical protein